MKLWQFMEVTDGGGERTWTWRAVGTSTGIETAAHPHPNYGAAVMDAIKHGFLPSIDRWVVTTAAGVTRFEPTGSDTAAPAGEKEQPPGAIDGKAHGH